MTHPPVRPVSQTHKFPKGRTNLVQITIIMIIAYVFHSLDRASDRIRRYRTAYFANIRIRIIRAFFPHKTTNCAILAIKQLPYNPTTKHFEVIGYFEEVSLLKQ